MKLTLIGNGIMAQALARGLMKQYEIEIIGRDEKKLLHIKEKLKNQNISIKIMEDVENISGKNIILCVKPYALSSVSARLEGKANVLLSILAGTSLQELKNQIKSKHYIRTMPNIAASYQNSMTTITGDIEVKKVALELCSCIGRVLWVDTEKQLNIATAIAGSGPAFLAIIAEAIADGAVKAGLERHLSTQLVQGLFSSSSSLLQHSHPALIKDAVSSPGGTTIAGVAKLEEHSVRTAMIEAINSAYEKAEELAKK